MKDVRTRWKGIAAVCAAAAFGWLAAAEPAQQKPQTGAGKNVQYLTGMSDLQLQRTMNMMRGSLGVHCDFCHVTEEGKGWDFAKDDKETKKTARRMIKMVIDLNRDSFDGQPRISCYTCHQGSIRPTSSITLPQTAPPFPTKVPPRVTPDMPSAAQVLDRYVEALGGRGAIDRLTSRSSRGTTTTWDGKELPFEMVQTSSGGSIVQVTQPQGVTQRVFDGATGWFKGPRGVRDLDPEESAEARRSANLYAGLRLEKRDHDFTMTGRQSVADRDCWVLAATGDDGRADRFFFDVATGLLARRVSMAITPIGLVPEQTDFDDWRDVDGLKEPFQVKISYVDPWVGQTRRLAEVKHNVAIEAERFVRPRPAVDTAGKD